MNYSAVLNNSTNPEHFLEGGLLNDRGFVGTNESRQETYIYITNMYGTMNIKGRKHFNRGTVELNFD
jgi:hypothetical protein